MRFTILLTIIFCALVTFNCTAQVHPKPKPVPTPAPNAMITEQQKRTHAFFYNPTNYDVPIQYESGYQSWTDKTIPAQDGLEIYCLSSIKIRIYTPGRQPIGKLISPYKYYVVINNNSQNDIVESPFPDGF